MSFRPDKWEGRFEVEALPPWDERVVNLGRQLWVYREPFAFISERFGRFQIPEGFYTDFASTPAIVRNLIDDDDPHLLFPSGPHDLGYWLKGHMGPGRNFDQGDIDLVILEAMESVNAPWWKRKAVYGALRVGGLVAWNKHIEADAQAIIDKYDLFKEVA